MSTLKDKLREIIRDAFDSRYFGGESKGLNNYIDDILALLLSSVLAELPKEKGVWRNKNTNQSINQTEILRLGETYIFDNEARIYNECLKSIRRRITKLLGGK